MPPVNEIDSEGVAILEDTIAECGPAEKLKPFEAGKLIGSYQVQQSDIDMLGHVNNVKYAEWLLNQIGPNSVIEKIEIHYLKETHLGAEVEFYQLGNQYVIRSKTSSENITLFKISSQ